MKHSLTYALTESSGLQTFPEFVAVLMVDEVEVGFYDSNNKRAEPKEDWMKKIFKDDPQQLEWYTQTCVAANLVLETDLDRLKQHLNQTGGIYIFCMFK